VNSIDNFAKSWSRAANFHEITPNRPPLCFEDDDTDPNYVRKDIESTAQGGHSLLRDAFAGRGPEADVAESSRNQHLIDEQTPLRSDPVQNRLGTLPSSWAESIFSVQPSLASGFGGSYGTMYASQRRPSTTIRPHAADIFREEQAIKAPEGEAIEHLPPLIIKQIEEDGVMYTVVVGQSTLPQTVFNSVNVLIGVGLLSLPLGLLYSGWLIGLLFMTFAGIATQYTAKLLAKCLDVDNSLITFADLAYVSFGSRARIATSILFSLELIAACVALVILFADSLNALLPGLSTTNWKIVCGVILIPLSFLPLSLLSFTSVLGILCCLASRCFRVYCNRSF
jgi:solute carrier family 32 (vesicular inhibitory amino acid transporter)